MCILKLQVFLIVLSVALNSLKATPMERQEWIIPVLSRNMLLELRGAKWKHGNATSPHVQCIAWQIF
uniref:Islet amyloid polypeptide n=1 Tax=Aotus nancymaae TaxID=37293 RepID=A0A2K5E340_AOTNA